VVERVTGVRFRYVADLRENASDLAVAAAGKVLAASGLAAADVDLLVFASASQDMVEPATAHMVGAALGTRCPAFDVKDACNSFLQGVGVADALIRTGRHTRVLVVTGETPSRGVRWSLSSREQYVESLPGYTLSDGGAAMLLERTDADGPGLVEDVSFAADSSAWAVGTLPGGGSAFPRVEEAGYFKFAPAHLRAAFEAVGPGPFLAALDRLGLTWADFAIVGLHQVAVGHARIVADRCGIPPDLLVPVVADHGNLASASLPFQLTRAIEAGRCGPGDRIALVGLAGGISLGLLVATL
jgi:3-oxoacyl-[acyl-carrier-protein] synthase-3